MKLYPPDLVVLEGNDNDPLEGTTIPLELILTKISNALPVRDSLIIGEPGIIFKPLGD